MHRNRVVVILKKVFDYPKAMLNKDFLFDDAKAKALQDFSEELVNQKESIIDTIEVEVTMPELYTPKVNLNNRNDVRGNQIFTRKSLRKAFVENKCIQTYGVVKPDPEVTPKLFNYDDENDEHYPIEELEINLDIWYQEIDAILARAE